MKTKKVDNKGCLEGTLGVWGWMGAGNQLTLGVRRICGGGWFLSCIERTLRQSAVKLVTDNTYTMHGIIRTFINYVLSAIRFSIVHVWLPQVIDDMVFTPIMDWLGTDHHVVNGELPDDNTTEIEAINEGGGGV